jgi:hypothetical protein
MYLLTVGFDTDASTTPATATVKMLAKAVEANAARRAS